MISHPAPTVVRRATRAVALTPAVLLLAATPALAAPPEQWATPPEVSPLNFLIVLVLIPGALFLLITLLAWLPSLGKSEQGYHPGSSWHNEPEWFGGPRDGLRKADEVAPETLETSGGRGGSSGRW
ncbi:hypothetical protein [Nocardioides mesophilus]|uniref:Secreted protein n=1 Tax=Nocardioides mesophilus TaxID=433659 RepID=A0A7G9RCT7_9ACTN|nr:hypothetical protein [Nocardioides mesophilus]QNN53412.1 hypothetical protein H9L09_02860 [Nocardioides mesophilus]